MGINLIDHIVERVILTVAVKRDGERLVAVFERELLARDIADIHISLQISDLFAAGNRIAVFDASQAVEAYRFISRHVGYARDFDIAVRPA